MADDQADLDDQAYEAFVLAGGQCATVCNTQSTQIYRDCVANGYNSICCAQIASKWNSKCRIACRRGDPSPPKPDPANF